MKKLLRLFALLVRYMREQLMPPFVLLVCTLLTGCNEPRHPDRDGCYLEAESKAAREGLVACQDYASTDDCPEWPAIEAQLKAEQEACK
jgi:hypothetical protein